MEILIVEEDIYFQKLFELNFQAYLGKKSEVARNFEQAKSYIESKPFDLIITRSQLHNEDYASKLFELTQPKKLPLIGLGNKTQLEPSDYFSKLTNHINLKDVVSTSAKKLGVTAKMMATQEVAEYYPIPLHYFNFTQDTMVDLFEQQEEDTFTQIAQAANAYSPELVEKAENRSQHFWYVKKEDRLKCVNYITNSILTNIDFDSLDENEQFAANELAQNLIGQKLREMGVTPSVSKLAKKAIKTLASSSIRKHKLGDLIIRLKENKSSYLFKHTQLATVVGFHLLKNIDWGNKDQMERLAFVSFFHDIMLENDYQAQIHTQEEYNKADLNKKAKDLVKNHALQAAALVNQIANAPMGVDQIIRQHHGSSNGVGFKDGFSTNVSPLAVVFMISEECARILLFDESPNKDQFLSTP